MALFSKINFSKMHDEIRRRVAVHRGQDWNTAKDGVSELRDALLELQFWRCVYCQAPIERHANGYRELDHILPKKSSRAAMLPKAHSELNDDRRITFGYPSFIYEPMNLVISCKECNNKKGTYDPLVNRARARNRYPQKKSFAWFHPHYHTYSDHIRLNDNFTFTEISAEGGAVIDQCGLADADGLERRFLSQAEALVARNAADGIKEVVVALAVAVRQKNFGQAQAANAVVQRYAMGRVEAEALISAWTAALEFSNDITVIERANLALQVVQSKVARLTA